MKERYERYMRWTAEVDKAAQRPENLAIAAQLRKKAEQPRPSSGIPSPTPQLFYLDWEQIKHAASPTKFGFTDAQDAFFHWVMYEYHFQSFAAYQKLPSRLGSAAMRPRSSLC
jgi:hypothetical protein